DAPSTCSALVLGVFLVVTVLDSVHFRPALPHAAGAAASAPVAYDTRTLSLLDTALAGLVRSRESSYSLPLATRGFLKETRDVGGRPERVFPRLVHGGAHLRDAERDWAADVLARVAAGLAGGLLVAVLIAVGVAAAHARRERV